MILLQVVVQVGTGSTAAPATQLPLLLQFRDHLRVAGVAVDVDHARAGMTGSLQGPLEKALGGSRIPLHRKPKVDGGTRGIDRTIQVFPVASHADVRFVYPPRTVGRLQFQAAPFIECRCVPLYPTPNARVVSRETSLCQKFLHVTIREGISQIPADRTKNDRWFEVSPFE